MAPRPALSAPLERSAAVSKTSRSAWEVRRRRELAACCGWSRTTQPRSAVGPLLGIPCLQPVQLHDVVISLIDYPITIDVGLRGSGQPTVPQNGVIGSVDYVITVEIAAQKLLDLRDLTGRDEVGVDRVRIDQRGIHEMQLGLVIAIEGHRQPPSQRN